MHSWYASEATTACRCFAEFITVRMTASSILNILLIFQASCKFHTQQSKGGRKHKNRKFKKFLFCIPDTLYVLLYICDFRFVTFMQVNVAENVTSIHISKESIVWYKLQIWFSFESFPI